MTTAEILHEDRKKLAKIDGAIMSLKRDKREKSQVLMHKFMRLRECVAESIKSNERALMMESQRRMVLNGIDDGNLWLFAPDCLNDHK